MAYGFAWNVRASTEVWVFIWGRWTRTIIFGGWLDDTWIISFCSYSFVRSVTMDKWKELELEKMKVGGNSRARQFFESQPDWDDTLPLKEKYETRAAALYRDKVCSCGWRFKQCLTLFLFITQISALARGESWSIETSSSYNYVPKKVISGGFSSRNESIPSSNSYSNFNDDQWQNNGYQK